MPEPISSYPSHVSAASPDALDAQPSLTPVQRVVDTFIAPSKTFTDIRRNTSWWLPFALLAVVGYLFSFAALGRVGIHTIVENSMKQNPKQAERMASQPPEQQAQTRKITESVTNGIFYVAPLLTLAVNCVTALLLWAGFNFVLGGSSTYRAMYAVGIFAWLPSIFKSLLSILLMFVGDVETFNIQNPVGTNPGFYLGTDASAWLKSFLTSFDVFTLWTLFLLGLGGAIVAGVKPAKGYALVFGAFLVFILIKTGFAAATS